MTADPPAWLLADRRVVLQDRGAVQAILAVEAVLRSDRRNGRAPGPDLAGLAAVLADALPPLAAVLPEVRQCWSAARAEAGLVPVALAARFWLTAGRWRTSPGPQNAGSGGPPPPVTSGPGRPRRDAG